MKICNFVDIYQTTRPTAQKKAIFHNFIKDNVIDYKKAGVMEC